jgi:hypothetical protein
VRGRAGWGAGLAEALDDEELVLRKHLPSALPPRHVAERRVGATLARFCACTEALWGMAQTLGVCASLEIEMGGLRRRNPCCRIGKKYQVLLHYLNSLSAPALHSFSAALS